jgi:hypothetical protein
LGALLLALLGAEDDERAGENAAIYPATVIESNHLDE